MLPTMYGDELKQWLAREREEARRLRATSWWHTQIQAGRCEYCQREVGMKALTMDHRVPLARGGRSTRGNVVACCKPCNQTKGLQTPVDQFLDRRVENSDA